MLDATVRCAVVVDFDIVVVVRIALLVDINKCFFAIATYITLRVDVVDAFLPVGTFASSQSTPFERNGATIGMTYWLAHGVAGRVVASESRNLPQQ
jgi:hypothetical protein